MGLSRDIICNPTVAPIDPDTRRFCMQAHFVECHAGACKGRDEQEGTLLRPWLSMIRMPILPRQSQWRQVYVFPLSMQDGKPSKDSEPVPVTSQQKVRR